MASIVKSTQVLFSSDKKLYQSLKNILGFYPGNITLYKQAFRHSSASPHLKNGMRNSNERLEFLGDAIISAVVANYLFKLFPFKDEGFLTKMRSRMVSRAQHNQLALKLGLNKYLEQTGNTGRSSSIHGDAYEALIGAIYLDKGFKKAEKFIIDRIVKIHLDLDEIENKEIDFKSKLIEWAQKEKKKINFSSTEEAGKNNEKLYTVQLLIDDEIIGEAQHFSKRRAEQLAAEKGFEKVGSLQ